MAFGNSQTFNIESKKMVNIEQFENSSRIIVPVEKPLKKVISVHALPKIISQEKIGETLSFSGRLSYQVVYLTEEDCLASVTHDVEWQGNINNIVWQKNLILATVQECTISDFSSVEIGVSALINIEVQAIASEQVTTLSELPDEYVKLEKNYIYNRVVAAINESWLESSEQEYNFKIDEMLFNDSSIMIKNITAGIDSLTLEGSIKITSSVVIEEKVEKITKIIDFKQEVGILGVVPENLSDVDVFVQGLKVTMSVNETDNKTNLIYAVDIGANIVVYQEDQLNVLEDAFSIKNQTVTNSECILKDSFIGEENYIKNLTLNFDLDADISEILYLSYVKPNITDVSNNEKTFISGGLEVGLVVRNENGLTFLVQGFAPFTCDDVSVSNTDKANIYANIESVKLNNKNVELIANFDIKVKKYSEEYIPFISKIEETEERETSNDSIVVYVVEENQTLFDVAKKLCVKPEEILKQNDHITNDLLVGDRIVVYLPLGIEF